MPKIASAQVPGTVQQSPDQNSRKSIGGAPAQSVSVRDTPANDNAGIDNLPPCLAVTNEEVRLLHRYLSREILDLFS